MRAWLAALAILLLGPTATAATFFVTSTADSGPGTLRAAVTAAAASPDLTNTIQFQLPASSTISLVTLLPPVTTNLVLDGSASPGVTIDAGALMPFFAPTSSLTFQDVSVTGGTSTLDLGFGVLTLQETGAGTFATNVNEPIFTIVKSGAGTTTIPTGTVMLTTLLGEIQINEGTLEVNGVVSGAQGVRVGPNGTLGGSGGGNIGGPTTIEGRVAPTTTSGSLTFFNGVTFTPGSVYAVDILPGNIGDTINSDTVTIQPGARLDILSQPSSITTDTTVTLVNTTTALTGSFQIPDFAFLDETVAQTATTLMLTLGPNGQTLSTLAQTDNQRAVAGTLTGLAPGTGDLADVLDAIDRSTTGDIAPLLDAIGGEPLTAFATGRQMLGERTARALHRRVRDRAWGQAEAFYASRLDTTETTASGFLGAGLATPMGHFAMGAPAARADTTTPAPVSAPRRHGPDRAGVWVDSFGLFGTLEGERGEAEVETTLFGGMLGFDAWLTDEIMVGLAGGYARGDLDPQGREADLTTDTIHGALYAGWTDSKGFLSAYGRFAHTLQSSRRRIETTQLNRTASADWDAQDFGAGAEAGLTVFSREHWGFQPLVGIDWLRLTEESFRESGAGSLNLDVDPEDLESVTGRFGGRVFGRIELDPRVELVPELRVFWQREFGDRDRALQANLIGTGPAGTLRVRGPELPRDAIIAGVGWSAAIGDVLQILLDYDVLLDSDRLEHQGNLALRLRF
ncbi:MAG: autotransporter outer membrane beta-barrel domain-containing protein [Myxococcota bacterium]